MSKTLAWKSAAARAARVLTGALAAATCCLHGAAFAADDNKDTSFFGLGLLEQTQAAGSARADALAQSLDRFFGVERSDLEAAYSSLRLITEARWEEGNYIEPRIRLRGRLHLPRVNERLSLLFSEDQGEGTSYYSQDPARVDDNSVRVNLEFNLSERTRDRWDFRIGLRSSGKLRTSVRYRYEDALGSNLQQRLSQTFYFIDATGYGSFSQYQIDYPLQTNSLLRWSNEFRMQENLDGNEWGSSLAYMLQESDSTGISVYAGVSGLSKYDYVGNYKVGLRLRRNVARPWLFWEVLPGYQWEKAGPTITREGGVFVALRLEMALGKY